MNTEVRKGRVYSPHDTQRPNESVTKNEKFSDNLERIEFAARVGNKMLTSDCIPNVLVQASRSAIRTRAGGRNPRSDRGEFKGIKTVPAIRQSRASTRWSEDSRLLTAE